MLTKLQTALITGASSGIGAAFAHALAERGKDLILVARSEDKLNALAQELAERHQIETHVIVADLARPDAARSLHAETENLGLPVDLLINNAGYGKLGPFAELGFDVQADMVRLNTNTLVELTRLYLPAIQQRQKGGVINVASTAAFQPTAQMAVYAATKVFVLNFSVALAEEVASDGVTVMALCPGWTETGFQAVAGTSGGVGPQAQSAQQVVTEALRAFDRGKAVHVPGILNKFLAFLTSRLLPRRLVAQLSGKFLGRT